MTDPISRAAVLEILRTPAASDTFLDMIRRVEALEGCGVRVKALIFSPFQEGGCTGRPYPFQYFITQAHNGRFLCHHDETWHDSLQAAQENAQEHYQNAALEPVAQPETPWRPRMDDRSEAVARACPWRMIADDPPPYETRVLTWWPGNALRNPVIRIDQRNSGKMLGKRDGWWTAPPAEVPTHWQPLPGGPRTPDTDKAE